MSMKILENETLKLKADPARGAGIVSFYAKNRGRDLAIMPDTETDQVGPEMACFLMAPYSNRIEDGRFTFQGAEYELLNSEEHALHGTVRYLPWQIATEGETSLTLRFDSKEHESVNWPWPFVTEVVYELVDNVFASGLRLWNAGHTPMPAGMGWHPFFNRILTANGEPLYLEIDIPRMFPDANDNRIPSGPSDPVHPQLDFSVERLLDPHLFIDNCFIYRNGNGHLRWPESGVTAELMCSKECSHIVFYNPPESFFALEPVTNANNGVNLFENGDHESGIEVLKPGDKLEATCKIKIRCRDQ